MQPSSQNGTRVITGQIRLHLGAAHEQAVAAELERRRWVVQPFGQGLIRAEIREALLHRSPAVLWRWVPDLIAVRGRKAALVDPKTSWRGDTGNVAIEYSAILAHRMMGFLMLPIIYVFDTPLGYLCAHHDELTIARYILDTGTVRGGSGTPFALVHHSVLTPFDAEFGAAP